MEYFQNEIQKQMGKMMINVFERGKLSNRNRYRKVVFSEVKVDHFSFRTRVQEHFEQVSSSCRESGPLKELRVTATQPSRVYIQSKDSGVEGGSHLLEAVTPFSHVRKGTESLILELGRTMKEHRSGVCPVASGHPEKMAIKVTF